jgi:hypothetical protein
MKQRKDPVTGDPLTLGEWVSWKVQEVIRNWVFLGVLSLITVLCWTTANAAVLTWWNLAASFYAVVLETIVGIAFFSQTRRDAVYIRRIYALEERIDALLEHAKTGALPEG